jgi:CDP-diacylglycerol--serine O-phosphatidyltransferase
MNTFKTSQLLSLPNLLTLANLFCGICAVINLLYGQFETAAWFVGGSAVADFLDGLVARALGISGPLGVQLDSLADVVSFGVVPGVMLYMLLLRGQHFGDAIPLRIEPTALPALILPLFAALRLAKFNIDTRQTTGFIGLNTPATTLFVTGLLLVYRQDAFGIGHALTNATLIYALIALLCYLMVSEIPMFGFKWSSFAWRGNEVRLTFVAVSVLLLIVWGAFGLSATIALYVLTNLVLNFIRK